MRAQHAMSARVICMDINRVHVDMDVLPRVFCMILAVNCGSLTVGQQYAYRSKLRQEIMHAYVRCVKIAPPGWPNLRLKCHWNVSRLAELLQSKQSDLAQETANSLSALVKGGGKKQSKTKVHMCACIYV